MSRTLFIADLHLCQEEPAITAGFLRFLQREAQTADALYILGDLFEAWIGDDDPNPLHQQIATALRTLPLPVWFIHGNRDFLLGQRYARASGMTLLPEEQVLNLYGRSILIMHGDTLCTDDEGYQRFRRKVHQAAEAVSRPAAAAASAYRAAYARRQQKRQQPEVHGNYGCQCAGGQRGDAAPSGSVVDPRSYPSSGGPYADGERPARRAVGAGRLAQRRFDD